MEQLIWNLLGYLAMPMIFVAGFAATALFACMVLDLAGIEPMADYD
ncbi:TIGR02808 family protein [Motiliproteus sediminis]|nr:TIGR02808 family protein [Motiliproteus sediminis]